MDSSAAYYFLFDIAKIDFFFFIIALDFLFIFYQKSAIISFSLPAYTYTFILVKLFHCERYVGILFKG